MNGAFSQASLVLNRRLRGLVHEMVGEARQVLDLYCGNGNLSLGLPAERVLGVDQSHVAVRAAGQMRQGEYRMGREEAFREALGEADWEAVILDPPRAGAKAIVEDLAGCGAPRMVYVSCNPATLARDLKGLVQGGWQVDRVVVLDMFPNTPHIETVCLLTR